MRAMRNLPNLIRKQFKAAQENGDLIFYPTRVAILPCADLPFQVRFSPALASKPKASKPKSTKPIDPFENPAPGLFIVDLPPSHYLLLNKFPIIPDHFILATKAFKRQTALLEEHDLGTAYQCLKEYQSNGDELFGFFNSGEHSGASQPHRHIQFLPVESMRSGIDDKTTWAPLVDALGNVPKPKLPFLYYASKLPKDLSASDFHKIYLDLLDQACSALSLKTPQYSTGSTTEDDLPLSYNLGFTDRVLALCPRISEGGNMKSVNGEIIGPVALNGTVLGGTLLVKNEAEWDALHNDSSQLEDVLRAIGLPPSVTSPTHNL